MEGYAVKSEAPGRAVHVMSGVFVLLGLYFASLYSYPLFHSLAEIFSIVVACGIFMIAWNTRESLENPYLLFIGIAYLFVGGIDLFHTLAYKGMGIFHGYGTNPATQLWIAARFMESITLLLAPLFFGRKIKAAPVFFSYAAVSFLLLLSIFYWDIFPACFVEGTGLTPFKKMSEYVICLILLGSGALLCKNRERFDRPVLQRVLWSIVATIGSELSFTFYISAYGFSNLVGHFLKILSFYFIYKAIIETGLSKPYNLLLRNLKQSEEALRGSEESLRLSEEHLRVTLTSIGDAVMATDTSGRITFLNPVAVTLTGWRLEEAVGQPVRNVFRIIDEKTGEPAEDIVGRVLREGHVVALANHTSLITRDGRFVPIEDSAAPIEDKAGNVSGVVVVFHDVTEMRLAREALLQSEARFRLLSETADGLLASEDPQGTVNDLCRKVMEHMDCDAFLNFLAQEGAERLHLNACAGIPEEEVPNIEWLDYGVAVCGCVARDGVRIVAEDIFHTPDPRTELVKSYGIQAYACHPLMARGRLVGTLSFGTRTRPRFSPEDLTLMNTVADQVAVAVERMRLIEALQRSRDELEIRVQERTAELNRMNEEQKVYTTRLEQSNRELEEFAFVASHDLQEPLRKIQTFSDRVKNRYFDSLGDTGRDHLERIQASAGRMQELIQDLLEYSSITRKRETFTPVDLKKAVEEALTDLKALLAKTEGRAEIGELPVIEADRPQMSRLFQKIVENGLKYHGEAKPVIKVYAASPCVDGFWEIHVEDNGIGFDECYLQKIFKPYQRLHGKESIYQGTGMGLAICRRIAERHGGGITARSEPGKGSTFIVRLPGKALLR